MLAYRNGSYANQPGWSLRVVPNKFPVLGIEGDLEREGDGMLDKMQGVGAHEVVVALKDYRAAVVANTTGLPAAFPRPGAVRVLDNDRMTVWHYTWTPGVPTPMHFHDKDVVVAFRYDGTLKSVTPDGTSVSNPYKAGDIRFNKANRSHYEELTTDRQSAVMVELK